MHVNPISAYRFVPISPLKSTKKSGSTKKIKSSSSSTKSERLTDADDVIIEDTLEILSEDEESSQAAMEYKDEFAEVGAGFDVELFKLQLSEAADVAEFYDDLPQFTAYKKMIFYQSFKQLSLPEALIYYAVLHQKLPSTFNARLKLEKKPHWKQALALRLELFSGATVILGWSIYFDFNDCIATVYEKGKQVAWLRYVIRGQKLEEIDGHFKGKPFILDPVWSPHKKGDLKQEYITFGSKRYALLYSENEKFSVWHSPSGEKQFRTKHKKLKRDKNRILTQKKVTFTPYKGQMKLLYVKGILIPVGGQFSFSC
ncbi:hypothetical protein DID80_06330 [Candidatus Marinamargulisbacteria bacterium SCGC AAA071-K20]|nr:hypothetical protein DID80_06330 [Candidatus Marinamargulisbacteria bacterium SCGC AAA071-K20]